MFLAWIMYMYPLCFALICRDLQGIQTDAFANAAGASVLDWLRFSYSSYFKIVLLDALSVANISLSPILPYSGAAKSLTLLFCVILGFIVVEGIAAIVKFRAKLNDAG